MARRSVGRCRGKKVRERSGSGLLQRLQLPLRIQVVRIEFERLSIRLHSLLLLPGALMGLAQAVMRVRRIWKHFRVQLENSNREIVLVSAEQLVAEGIELRFG